MSDYRLNFDTDYDMDQERPEGLEDLSPEWREYIQHREILCDGHRDLHEVYKQLSEDLKDMSESHCRRMSIFWIVAMVVVTVLGHI